MPPHSSTFRRTSARERWLTDPVVWALLAAPVLFQLVPPFFTPQIIDYDFRQHLVQFYQARHPGIFPDDLVLKYFRERFAMPFHSAFFAIVTQVMDPILATKAVTLILALVSGLLLVRTTMALTGASPRFSTLLAIASYAIVRTEPTANWLVSCSSATQKSFGVPLMMAFALSVAMGSIRWRFVLIGLSVGFYPPLALTLLFYFLFQKETWKWSADHESLVAKSLLATTALGLVVLKAYLGWGTASGGGPYTLSEALRMPEFTSPSAMIPYLRLDASGIVRSLGPYKPSTFLVVFFLTIVVVHQRAKFPKAYRLGRDYFLSGMAVWLVALLAFERLYEPSRYAHLALRLCVPVGVMILGCSLREWLSGSSKTSFLLRLPRSPAVVTVVTIVILLGSIAGLAASVKRKLAVSRPSLPTEVYDFFRNQPPDILVGGNPSVIEDIMIRSLRKVVAIESLIYPYDRHYYPLFKQRILDMLETECDPTRERLASLRRTHGIDFFVLDLRRRLSGPWMYVEPFATELSARTRGTKSCTDEFSPSSSGLPFEVYQNAVVLDLRVL